MSLAKSYARALLDAAHDAKSGAAELDKIEQQLKQVASAIESSREAKMALFSPALSTKEKANIAVEIAKKGGISPLLGKFLLLLANKERLTEISSIAHAFGAVRLESEGGVLGRIDSADTMEESDIEALSKSFSQKLGKKVAFVAEVDPNLLAGIKVTVNGVTYDGTLKSQLQRLRDRLVTNTQAVH